MATSTAAPPRTSTSQVRAHGDGGDAAHGGRLIEAGDVVLEWVAAQGLICLSEHGSGAALATDQASGRVVVAGAGALTLTPTGGNCLKLAAALPAGAKAVVSIRLPGLPPVQARIEP